ncbi:LCP family protein required for cell wall assembly [Weissella beninensis]|uniref:LCP family protein n=1 Tax=Periweissella beninensis TaxID=504936 RepID=UPI00195FEB83|nr:LCP family protein [Periweissella beninensis]MBM7543310.1 LCP family protein required for cell wall assembly [Periweissella beninensis]
MDNQSENLTRRKLHQKPVKKRHIWRYIILAIVAIFVASGAGYLYYTYSSARSALNKSYVNLNKKNFKSARNVSQVLKDGKPISILLLGTDTGSLDRTYTGRTDSIMVATINPKTKTTTLMSIPRDSMVSIPNSANTSFQFPQKINAAYEFPGNGKGHPETTISTVQKFLNIPIDFYALINMGGLKTMINKVGGIKVKSPLTFTYQPSHKAYTYKFFKGKTSYQYAKDGINFKTYHVMNGKAALAFSRMRYTDPQGDYGRQKRQRLVLTALAKESSTLSSLLTPGFFETMTKNVQTSLSFNDLVTIASTYKIATKTIKSDHMQGTSYNYNGVAYEVIKTSEKQRVTNVIRKSLGLSSAKTGARFGGTVSNNISIPDSEATLTAATDAARDGNSSSSSTSSSSSSSTVTTSSSSTVTTSSSASN